jgi:O-antigen/teichoic acid export membrane protein
LQGNRDLLRNAGSLAATSGLTSILGFVFWFVAARSFTKSEIGYGAAATNMIQLLGTVGMFGLGTMLIGELPRRRVRGGLFMASIITSAAGSLVLGLFFPFVAKAVHANVPEMDGTLLRVLLFAVGVTLTGATMVFDEGTIGLMRGGVQLWRNLAMSGFKLLALPVTAIVMHDEFGTGIMLSFVIGTALSMIPAVIMLVRGGSKVWHRPDWPELRRLFSVALNHNWLNLVLVTPARIIPVIVTLVVSPTASGVFYIAWMLVSFLFMVPAHLSTVLFAIASASPELIAEKLRFVLRVSVMIGLPVMAVLAISAHFALSLFGHDGSYATLGTVPLWLLIIGYIPQMPKAQFIAVSRATNKVGRAAILLGVTSTCEIVAIIIGGKLAGLNGCAFGYLGVLICEGLITAPVVLRAAYARTATGAFPIIPGTARATGALRPATGPLARMTGELVKLTGSLTTLPGAPDRQETGLAALIALAASAAVSDGRTFDVATEVWRTGAFPALPSDVTGPRRVQNAQTTLDMLGGQSASGIPMSPGGVPGRQLSYRHRQQAGIDALIAIATTVPAQDDEPAEEPR